MAERRVLVLQHHPLEHPGVLTRTLTASGATLEVVRVDLGAPCPRTLDGYDGLLVMGGPMGVRDGEMHPWLVDERALLARAMATDLPTLTICLGAQQLAAAAGAVVTRGPAPEIGWHRISPTAAACEDPVFAATEPFAALEWHNDVFALPAGAVALASSARCPVQAYRLGRRVYGMLFHLEVDAPMVDTWCETFAGGGELPAGDAQPEFAAANRRAATIAQRLFLE
jgi:GMP synthase (glutamine-hydrolysing)